MRCRADLKADDSLHPAQEGRFPAFDFELLGIEFDIRQRSVGAEPLARTSVRGMHLEPAFSPVRRSGKAVYSKTQAGQNVVIDDIVKKYGVRVEGILRQDDAIIEWPVLADSDLPGISRSLL